MDPDFSYKIFRGRSSRDFDTLIILRMIGASGLTIEINVIKRNAGILTFKNKARTSKPRKFR